MENLLLMRKKYKNTMKSLPCCANKKIKENMSNTSWEREEFCSLFDLKTKITMKKKLKN